MSEATTEAPQSTDEAPDQSEADAPQADRPPKPTETVDFWKSKAREQEARAKANKSAADELQSIKDQQKSESERAADRISRAEAEMASVPAKVADALKSHLVSLHSINDEDAELFLTASDPELLLKQVGRLMAREQARVTETKKQGNHVPREGANPNASESDERQAVRAIFGGK